MLGALQIIRAEAAPAACQPSPACACAASRRRHNGMTQACAAAARRRHNGMTQAQLHSQRLREATLAQPTWFCARSVFDAVGGYVEAKPHEAEDLLFFYAHIARGAPRAQRVHRAAKRGRSALSAGPVRRGAMQSSQAGRNKKWEGAGGNSAIERGRKTEAQSGGAKRGRIARRRCGPANRAQNRSCKAWPLGWVALRRRRHAAPRR